MLRPRVMQAVGLVILAASAYGNLVGGLDEAALMVGIPLGVAILAGSVVGGGPEPSTPGGEDWEEAMATLSRVTKATALVAGGFVVAVAILWHSSGPTTAPGVGPVDVLVVFALALLIIYGAIVAAAAILLVSHATGRNEDG